MPDNFLHRHEVEDCRKENVNRDYGLPSALVFACLPVPRIGAVRNILPEFLSKLCVTDVGQDALIYMLHT
jgi:hypothetical protein